MTIPEKLGPYRVLERIGRGGMAEVFKGVAYGASGFERLVALKTLLGPYRGIGRYERLLIEEAKIGARLRHQNLVQTHDLGVQDGSYFTCLEYVDGADLARLGPPQPELVWLMAEEIAHALEFVHQACDERGASLGLVHRDVSPSNVLISRAGEVKLADFGIVKSTTSMEHTQPNVRKGKFAYMSPEQVRGEALQSTSDQFGFGVMLYELMLDSRPFDGGSVTETLERIGDDRPCDVSQLPAEAQPIVRRCLQKQASARFPHPAELTRAISAVRRRMPPVAARDLATWVDTRMRETTMTQPS